MTLARSRQEASRRRPFFLYIDEFHHVATPSMASLFSGARKYGLGLTVAHQDLHQLHASVPEVERSLLANAYTRICFRVGEADARQLEKGFSYFAADDLMSLSVGEAICRMGSRNADFNLKTEQLPSLGPAEAGGRRDALRDLSRSRWAVAPDGEGEANRARASASARTKPQSAKEEGEARASGEARKEPERRRQPPGPRPDKETLDYIESVATEPFLSIRQRNEDLGLSAWKGSELKKALLEAGLVREVAVHPGGRGERFKLLEFTQTGRRLLAEYGIAAPTGYGRGGIAHQWWVRTIAEWLEQQGLSPFVEDETQEVRVDLLVEARRKKVAVEVEMTDGHVLENIRKDLAAGFDLVVTLLDNSIPAQRFEEALSAELESAFRPKVRLGHLQEYEQILAPPLSPTLLPYDRRTKTKNQDGAEPDALEPLPLRQASGRSRSPVRSRRRWRPSTWPSAPRPLRQCALAGVGRSSRSSVGASSTAAKTLTRG